MQNLQRAAKKQRDTENEIKNEKIRNALRRKSKPQEISTLRSAMFDMEKNKKHKEANKEAWRLQQEKDEAEGKTSIFYTIAVMMNPSLKSVKKIPAPVVIHPQLQQDSLDRSVLINADAPTVINCLYSKKDEVPSKKRKLGVLTQSKLSNFFLKMQKD